MMILHHYCSKRNLETSIKIKVYTQSFEVEDVKLRGLVDRIDVDQDHKLYNVVDYKLKGKKPTRQELLDGLSLQLPVYLLAGKSIINKVLQGDYSGYKMIIYSLDFNEKNFGPKIVNPGNKRNPNLDETLKINEHQLAITKDKIKEYHTKISEGEFNLSELKDREDKVCRFCSYRSLCRVQEVFEV